MVHRRHSVPFFSSNFLLGCAHACRVHYCPCIEISSSKNDSLNSFLFRKRNYCSGFACFCPEHVSRFLAIDSQSIVSSYQLATRRQYILFVVNLSSYLKYMYCGFVGTKIESNYFKNPQLISLLYNSFKVQGILQRICLASRPQSKHF